MIELSEQEIAAGLQVDKPFSGFGFAIRTFYLEIGNLHCHRIYSEKSQANLQPKTFISGTAKIKDAVSVIGTKNKTQEFSVSIKSDEEKNSEWEAIKRISNVVFPKNMDTSEGRVTKHIYEALDKNPPTAVLFYSPDDHEVGVKGGWNSEIKIPNDIIKQLEEDFKLGYLTSIHVGIEWQAGLVEDVHSPPAFPTTWGLFTLESGREAEPLQGHVKSVRWEISRPK